MASVPPPELEEKGNSPSPPAEKDNENGDDGTTPMRRKVTGFSWFIVVIAVLSAVFLYALDNTVMANVRPSIVETFDRIDMLTWMSVAYPMGEVGANPLW